MPRNGSGSYTLPEAAFVPQTPISSSAMNSDLSDLATAMTNSLARNGEGGMTAVLPMTNAGATYISDPDTGLHRTDANEQALFCGSVDIVTVNSAGAEVAGDLEVSGDITKGGFPLLPIGLGPLPYTGLTAPAFWVFANGAALLRASYPELWAFAQNEIANGNTLYTNGNGTTTFTIADMRGRVPAGNDDMDAGAAGRLTNTTMTPNGTTLGAAGGAQTHTLSTPELASHTHVNTLTDNGHQHAIVGSSGNGGGIAVVNGGAGAFSQNNLTASATTNIVINNTAAGGGGAHNNVQPTLVTNYIIYAGA